MLTRAPRSTQNLKRSKSMYKYLLDHESTIGL